MPTYSVVDTTATTVKLTEDSRELIYKKVYCSCESDGDDVLFMAHELETGLLKQQYRFHYTDCAAPTGASASAVATAINEILNNYAGGGSYAYSQINVFAAAYNPVDSQTVRFGNASIAPTTTAAIRRVYANRDMTIVAASIRWYAQTVAGSGENISVYVCVNNTTDTLIATIGTTAAEKHFSNTGLSISLTAGDYFEIKIVQPAWATNPTGVLLSGYITVI